MSPDRTSPTTLRTAPPAARATTREAPADGFAALLGAAAQVDEPRERPARAGHGGGSRPEPDTRARERRDSAARADDPSVPLTRGGGSTEPSGGEVAPDGAEPAAPHAVEPSRPDVTAPAIDRPVAAAPEGAAPVVVRPAELLMPTAPIAVAAPAEAGPAVPLGSIAPRPAAQPPAPQLPGAVTPADETAAPDAAPVEGPAAAPALRVPAQLAEAPDAQPPAVPADTPDAQPPTVPAEAPDAQPPTVPAGSQPAKPGTDAPVQAPVASTAPEQAPPAADAPSPAPPAAAPAPPPAPAPQPSLPLQRAAPLHHAPRAVAQMLELAVERGISHAKLSLRPADLGGVEIRLQSSSAGVTAQVVADSPEAARLLQHAAADLRRALERHDVTLLSLDVSTAGDGRPDGSAGASADLAGDRARHFAAQGLAPRETADSPDEPPTPIATVQLPDGLHVDVLA